MKTRRRQGESGFTLIELMIVMLVLVIVSQAFSVFLQTATRGTQIYRDRAYATDKASQMLEELRSLVADSSADITLLDKFYNDGRNPDNSPLCRYTLTTKRETTHPGGNTVNDAYSAADLTSANPMRGGDGFVFARHVQIMFDPKDPNQRRVYVRVWRSRPNPGYSGDQFGNPSVPATPADSRPLAEAFGIIKSLTSEKPPTQVMDVYFIAIENVPGWWSRTSNLFPLMQASVTNIMARNPGLNIRQHWVTRLSYGRDLEYAPEINSALRADDPNAFSKTYVYPGKVGFLNQNVTPNDAYDDFYYSPDWFKSRINKDGVIENKDGYAVADQWNHAMRLRQEEEVFQVHAAVRKNQGQPAPEPSLRMLLEKLNSGDPNYVNSVIINLHGELVPHLPIRNVSDAASDPQWFWNDRPAAVSTTVSRAFRAVTHPEQLHFSSATEQTAVRVYAYEARSWTATTAMEDDPIDVVTLFVPGANTDNLKQVERLQGSSRSPYHWHGYGPLTTTAWNSSGGYLFDGGDTPTSHFVADNFTNTATGRSGLRIRLFGVSATAQPYLGKPMYTGVVE